MSDSSPTQTLPSETLQRAVAILLQDNILRIEEEQWSEALRQELQHALKQHQIDDLTGYRSHDTPRYYYVCIRGHQPDEDLAEQAYQTHSTHLRLAPLIIAIVILAITALLARDLNRLMSSEFLFWSPFVVGALCQYFVAYEQPNRTGNLFATQAIALVVLLIFSISVLQEGSICVIMASPLIYMAQVFGAFVMKVFCDSLWVSGGKVYSLSVLPLMLVLWNPFSSSTINATTNEIIINAPVAEVFQSINNIQAIQEHEIQDSFIFWIGFPKPVSGMTVTNEDGNGLTRQIHWQRGIYFEEHITHNEANSLLGWVYRFTPASFPKGSMDDHVEVSGEYFDLDYTDYRLEQINENQTKLILTIAYRLNTEFNWYAKPWTDYVLNEFSAVVLNVYKKRLESSFQPI